MDSIELIEFYQKLWLSPLGLTCGWIRTCFSWFWTFFQRFLEVFWGFLLDKRGWGQKKNSAFDRARRALSWSNFWANPSEKYSNPDERYPTCCINVTIYNRIRRKTAVLRFVFRCKRWPFFDVYYTVSHDRNTVPAKRAIYGTFTAVSSPFLNVYVNENGGIRWFTIVISIDLGIIGNTIYDGRKKRNKQF